MFKNPESSFIEEPPVENHPEKHPPVIQEITEDNSTKIICRLNGETAGSVSANLIGPKKYMVTALFVDPSKRNQGIGSLLIKNVNEFLERKKSEGILVNMAKDAGNIYRNNGWKEGLYKTHGAYGGYEFTYDATEIHVQEYPAIGHAYTGFSIGENNIKTKRTVIYKGAEGVKSIILVGNKEYLAKLSNNEDEEATFEFNENDIIK